MRRVIAVKTQIWDLEVPEAADLNDFVTQAVEFDDPDFVNTEVNEVV